MTLRRRLLLYGLGVTALLALAGIASHGRPLAPQKGRGPSAAFWDYSLTTLLLAAAAIFSVVVYAVLSQRPGPYRRPRSQWRLLSSILTLMASALVAWLLLRHGLLQRWTDLGHHRHPVPAPGATETRKGHGAPAAPGRSVRVRWDEVVVALVLVCGAALVLVATRGRRRAPRPVLRRSQEAVSRALDESLDNLRSEPDLRRAIIAAYARMERALAHAGLPRRSAEAPLEYLERALGALDTSATAVRRLTVLFEWAKFSQHEPEPQMRDEAIDALVAVRDELREPDAAAVA